MNCLIPWCKAVYRCKKYLLFFSFSLASLIVKFLVCPPPFFFFFSSFPSPFCAALTGNTVIHLDKALARIREYERMKLKAEFNPCSASTAGAGTSDVSNAERPSANPAEHLEGT